jgi:hypothetical protein
MGKADLLAKGIRINDIEFPAPSGAFIIWFLERYKKDLSKLEKTFDQKPSEALIILWAIFNQDELGISYDEKTLKEKAFKWGSDILASDLLKKYIPAIEKWIAHFFPEPSMNLKTGEKNIVN